MQTEAEVELQRAHNDLIRSLVRALEGHAPGEGGHAERVAAYAVATGERLGLDDGDLLHLRRAAQLHDVGKVRVDPALLLKPERLSHEDWEALKLHAILAERVLESLEFLAPAISSIRHHHERWDGTGYPDGLNGERIPIGARIIAVAEAFDCLAQGSAFRPGVAADEALAEIRACSGSQFDPAVVSAFLQVQPLIQPVGM
jgi:HD-GYP domain-containing protein (c-di-GMP phosphodiesterase class II)